MRITLATFMMLGGITAHAEDLTYLRPRHVQMALMLRSPNVSVPVQTRRLHAEFLTCVYSGHECEHVAHNSGYRFHYVVHDHDTCHHGPSYACYAER